MIKTTYKCKEWVEIINGEEMGRDSHAWVEIIETDTLSTLKCELCGKHSTARKT